MKPLMPEYKHMRGVCGVYRIRNLTTNKLYVGSSKNIYQRWCDHFRDLNRGVHKNAYLQHAWDKYGARDFVFELIETCEYTGIIQREQFWIDELQSTNPQYGYNINVKADRVNYTPEVRAKLSQRTRQYNLLPEVNQQLRERAKQQGTLKSWTQTPEGQAHLYRISHAPMTQTQLEALNKYNNSEAGKEHNRKLIQANRERKAKKVYQYTPELELVQTYYTPIDVDTDALGCHFNSIARACRENARHPWTHKRIFKGFIWSYEEKPKGE